MGKEYTTRSFKSGNSVAIRMPAGLGVAPDREWIVAEDNGDLVLRPKDRSRRKFNIAKVAGSASDLEFIKDEDRLFEERPPRWEEPAKSAER